MANLEPLRLRDAHAMEEQAERMQGVSGMFVTDEVVKAVLSAHAFEHMEIASYRILIAAAQSCGDTETAQTCRAILLEEEAMAGWLAEQMPSITTQYLQRSERPGVTAKH